MGPDRAVSVPAWACVEPGRLLTRSASRRRSPRRTRRMDCVHPALRLADPGVRLWRVSPDRAGRATESDKFQSHMNPLAIPMLVECPFVESESKILSQ